jgi:hypothetical protein
MQGYFSVGKDISLASSGNIFFNREISLHVYLHQSQYLLSVSSTKNETITVIIHVAAGKKYCFFRNHARHTCTNFT